MLKAISRLAVPVLATSFHHVAALANAITVDFEGLNISERVPSSYSGLSWDNDWGVDSIELYNLIYNNTETAPSGSQFAFNSLGVMSMSASGAPFDLVSALFSTWTFGDDFGLYSSRSVSIDGYRGTTLIGSITAELTTDFVLVNIGLFDIDRFVVRNDGQSQRWWIMDDLVYTTSVPEPGTLALFGLGLAVFSFAKLRKLN